MTSRKTFITSKLNQLNNCYKLIMVMYNHSILIKIQFLKLHHVNKYFVFFFGSVITLSGQWTTQRLLILMKEFRFLSLPI